MSENPSDWRPDRSWTVGRPLADCIIQALEKSDIAEPCQAIGAALQHLRPCAPIRDCEASVYRAFAGDSKHPNFALEAVGFRLHVTERRGAPASAARFETSCELPRV